MYTYAAVITRVVDADTLDADVDLGFGIRYRTRLRLFGVDAPEVRGEEKAQGERAKEYVEGLVLGKQVSIRTHKDRKGKYGRYLAEVVVDGRDLAYMLVEKGLAREIGGTL